MIRSVVFSVFILVCCPLSASAEKAKLWNELGSEQKPLIDIQLPSFAPVIKTLGKAVVNISIEGKEEVGLQFHTPGKDKGLPGQANPFDFLFKNPPGKKSSRPFSSVGSGFVINPEGYIITNNHVIDKASKIIITFKGDKKTYLAEVVGKDPKTDVALLKVDVPKKLEYVALGDSKALHPGDWVIAIGNPFRLGHTATVGIVSAKSRRVPGGGPYDDFIQTDASINPGNSGGPLFNVRGEVVGVNTAIFSLGRGGTGFNIGIGFATPINLVKSVISQLHEKGKVTRGWLGVLIQAVSPDMAAALKLGAASGALVADVLPDSPASLAGLQRGDVIVSFDGKEVVENDDLPLMVAQTPIGKKVEVEVIRRRKKKSIDVTIKELEEVNAQEESQESVEESRFGLSLQDITPDIARALGLEEAEGLVVAGVKPGSVANLAGLRRGDAILQVGSKEVKSVSEFRMLTKDIQSGEPVLLLVRRGENTLFLTLKIEDEEE